jgi:hypothetical protein
MTDDSNVVSLDAFRPKGNGAREALIGVLSSHDGGSGQDLGEVADTLLAGLREQGYRVEPV